MVDLDAPQHSRQLPCGAALQYPVYTPDPTEAASGLKRVEPSLIISKSAMETAVSLVKVSMSQLIVFSSQFAPLAASPIYANLRSHVRAAGNGQALADAEASSGSNTVVPLPSSIQRDLKRLLT